MDKRAISFCIATANNEREYVHLLLRSLQANTNIQDHEVLIFIDSDNQGTYESLVQKKEEMPNLKLYRNLSEYPVGSQRNVSILFGAAKNDIVCYLHSDMVVGKDFDRHLLDNLVDDNHIISCGRIEPPLHPPSAEKIVQDFGITPDEFNWDGFNNFVEKLQTENRPNINGTHGAFAIHKKTWFDVLGGYDPQFRCSSEDYDLVVRMRLNGIVEQMVWNACTYHFTCVSSRGKDWFKNGDPAISQKNHLQELASHEEHKRFVRKWGFFSHEPRPVYNIGLFVDMDAFADISLLEYIEPYFSNIYINDEMVVRNLIENITFKTYYYANLRWKYSHGHWENVKHLFNPIDFRDRIQYRKNEDASSITNDTVMRVKFSDLLLNSKNQTSQFMAIIQNTHVLVDQNEVGNFEFDGLSIDIRRKKDMSSSLKRVDVADMNLDEFVFS